MEYTKTTFGEWCKTHKPEGRTFFNCSVCGMVLLPEGTIFGTTKNCPCCNTLISDMRDESLQKWKCRRCGEFVDMEKKRCKCKESPSPWVPV